jgi:hypothetical protein
MLLIWKENVFGDYKLDRIPKIIKLRLISSSVPTVLHNSPRNAREILVFMQIPKDYCSD